MADRCAPEVAVLLVVAIAAVSAAGQDSQDDAADRVRLRDVPATEDCRTSPTRDVLDVVGPMTGRRPVWLVDADSRWKDATYPVKTLWVVTRTDRRLLIAGRRLDGPGTATFGRGSEPSAATLEVDDPARRSVRPGGATPDVLRAYAFIPSHVYYPSPGCWEFTVRIGDDSFTVVRRIEGQRSAPWN